MPRTAEAAPLQTAPHAIMERATMAAIRDLANWNVTRIIGPATAAEADCLKHDLIALAEIVDNLVEAFGAYANSTVGIHASDMDVFKTQLRDAIDGNATHVLDKQAEYIRDAYRDSDSRRHDFQRGLLEAAE